MIIYNITTQVTADAEDNWKRWLREEYLPAIDATGLLSSHQLVQLLELEQEEGATYAVQLYFENMQRFAEFRADHLSELEEMERRRWRDDVVSFASLMEVIN